MSSSLKSEEISLHDLHRSIVTVYVSPEKYPFYFHKGRLCRRSSFFGKAFHGSFEEAATGSIYLEEDGVDEFKLFEEWVYSGKFSLPKESKDPSLLLVKVFCFAEKVGISNLQNATLDAIRDRTTEQDVSLPNPNPTYEVNANPQTFYNSAPRPFFSYQKMTTNLGVKKTVAKYLLFVTSSAINYAYQNTLEGSPLRKLLADIFAYNAKPETLDENILLFPAEFMVDVLLINMKRIPLRLEEEEADFDKNADKYHVHDSSSTPNNRKQRTSEDVDMRGPKSDFDSRDEPVAEAVVSALWSPTEVAEPEPEPPTETDTANEDATWGFAGSAKSSSRKGKKKRIRRSE